MNGLTVVDLAKALLATHTACLNHKVDIMLPVGFKCVVCKHTMNDCKHANYLLCGHCEQQLTLIVEESYQAGKLHAASILAMVAAIR